MFLHERLAFDDTVALINKVFADKDDDDYRPPIIIHCFTGTKEQAQKIIDYKGFMIGIGGVVTFKNAGLDKVVKEIPMEHLVLETDSPYLAPHPYRGKRNESSFLKVIAHKIAEIHEVSLEEVANITTENSKAIFGI